jgi:hypothetical protein
MLAAPPDNHEEVFNVANNYPSPYEHRTVLTIRLSISVLFAKGQRHVVLGFIAIWCCLSGRSQSSGGKTPVSVQVFQKHFFRAEENKKGNTKKRIVHEP